MNKKRITISVIIKLNALEKLDKKPSVFKSYYTITGEEETVEASKTKKQNPTMWYHSTWYLIPRTKTLKEGEEWGNILCWIPRSSYDDI